MYQYIGVLTFFMILEGKQADGFPDGYGYMSLVIRVKDYPKIVLVSIRSEIYLLKWDAPSNDRSFRLLSAVDIGKPNNRINDGKVDAKGRLWFGTLGNVTNDIVERDKASFYMLNQYNYMNPKLKLTPVTNSNGLAWSSDNKYLFYTDSGTNNIDVFDFDLQAGVIRNRKAIFNFTANNIPGEPDGMTIDTEDNLWITCYNGGRVLKVDSKSGKLLEQYKFPVSKVTSAIWGGHDLSTLYVTSSRRGLTSAQLALQPEAGSLFSLCGTGARGYPQNEFVFPNADKY